MDSVTQAFNKGVVLGGILALEPWLHVAYPEDLNKKWQV